MARTRSGILAGVVVLASGALSSGLVQEAPPHPIETSRIAPLAVKSLLLDGVFIDGIAVVVGERGHVLLSEDQGRTWRQVQVPSRATLTGVHFHDRQSGWIVGHDATILRTRDGGESWERVYYDPEEESPLFDIWFWDADHGIAVGAYGLFLSTSDGGDTWERGAISEYDDFHLHHIAPSETGRLYLAAEAGTIYRSDDQGQSWISLPSPYEGSFFGTVPLDEDALLVFGLRGHLFRSEDAGESWERIDTGTHALLNRGLRLADGTPIVVGHEGTILTSSDDGRSFTLVEESDREALATVVRAGDGGMILVGEFGVSRMAGDETSAGPAP